MVRTLRAALRPYLPPAPEPDPDAAPPPETRLRTRDSLRDLLAGGGFTDVRFAEMDHRTEFARPELFWDWLWSAGVRGMLEGIAPADRDEARAATIALVDKRMRGADGTLGWTTTVRFTTAVA